MLALLMGVALSTGVLCAQSSTPDRPDSSRVATPAEITREVDDIEKRTTTLEDELAKLGALRISGYVQFEWQRFSQDNANDGRALYSDTRRNFFTIRRGRLKFQHRLNNVMSAVIQTDITETGARIKDAYAQFKLLPADELTVTTGLFNRPNYEVELSSGVRESAERAQVVRAFYPDERDLGVMFSWQPELARNFAPKLQLGVFNGTGTAAEVDPYKDIIARLTFPIPLAKTSPVQIDLGASLYHGGIPQKDTAIIQTVGGSNQVVAFAPDGGWPGWGNKQNINAEAQIYLKLIPTGTTTIKGEFLTGRRAAITGQSALVQLRNQRGYYAYFIQDFGTLLQAVLKYDYFDRNTDLSGAQVTAQSDAAFGVLGVGGNISVERMRITLWHEFPMLAADEIPFGGNARSNDIIDDKTTIRFQYRF